MAGPEKMSSGYNMKCPIARTLDIVGERWTMLVIRDLILEGPCKFQDFEKSLPGISASTLSARLKKLEEHGIIERKLYSDHPPRGEYALTAKGWTLGPVMKLLREWGSKHAT